MSPDADIDRILTLLKRAIRSSGLSQKEVDRRIGVQPGYLSQVMIGRLDLKLKHLLRVLEAIEIDPTAFFKLAFPASSTSDVSGSDVLSLLPTAESGGGGDAPEVDSEFQRLVARALAQELGIPVDRLTGAKGEDDSSEE
jgi:transcriptional regulator with XRE-family HTH domain